MHSYDLEADTRRRLKNVPRDISYRSLARDAGISNDWLHVFMRDKAGDYGIKKVTKVAKQLDRLNVK